MSISLITSWIDETLAAHITLARPVISFGFKRLPNYCPNDLLLQAKVVVTDNVPNPPLSRLGLSEFAGSLPNDKAGITLKNIYFLQTSRERDESVHFHELVHVIQWAYLGVEKFLLAYIEGLQTYGYENSPLEKMAYDLQRDFDYNFKPFDLETDIRDKLNKICLK